VLIRGGQAQRCAPLYARAELTSFSRPFPLPLPRTVAVLSQPCLPPSSALLSLDPPTFASAHLDHVRRPPHHQGSRRTQQRPDPERRRGSGREQLPSLGMSTVYCRGRCAGWKGREGEGKEIETSRKAATRTSEGSQRQQKQGRSGADPSLRRLERSADLPTRPTRVSCPSFSRSPFYFCLRTGPTPPSPTLSHSLCIC
jgi:hypothetical protein